MSFPDPRVPDHGEAEGYGASYRRDIGDWLIYWMPGTVPLGVTADTSEACEAVLAALRGTLIIKEPR